MQYIIHPSVHSRYDATRSFSIPVLVLPTSLKEESPRMCCLTRPFCPSSVQYLPVCFRLPPLSPSLLSLQTRRPPPRLHYSPRSGPLSVPRLPESLRNWTADNRCLTITSTSVRAVFRLGREYWCMEGRFGTARSVTLVSPLCGSLNPYIDSKSIY